MMLRFAGCILASIPTTSVPPLLLTALFYRRFRNERLFQRMHKVFWWASFCSKRLFQMDIRIDGRERLPADRSRLLFVSNHQSYVDIPMIMCSLGIGAFLSKRLVAFLPIIGQIAWMAGTIYFTRQSQSSRKNALDDVMRMCELSTPVVVFPEGTRSRDGNLREKVHLGAITSCFERNLRVSTFAFHGTRYVFPPTMDRFHGGQRVAIVVGDTFSPGDYTSAEAFAAAVWNEIERRFEEARRMHGSAGWERYHRV